MRKAAVKLFDINYIMCICLFMQSNKNSYRGVAIKKSSPWAAFLTHADYQIVPVL